jgi:RNA polymerase sigma-70 factor (ECF subfamily)
LSKSKPASETPPTEPMTTAITTNGEAALVWERVWLSLCAMASKGRSAVDSRPMRSHDGIISADVRAAADGDGEAFARIIREHQGQIAARMLRFARDPVVVEELVHDVFVEAYFSLGRYRGDAPLAHWLQRIATRVGYRYWKRRERERARSTPLLVDVTDPRESPEPTDRHDAVDAVAALLERMSPRDRLVLTLLYIESRSVAEAAELAGWSQTMVKVQAHRARQRLRKLVVEFESAGA